VHVSGSSKAETFQYCLPLLSGRIRKDFNEVVLVPLTWQIILHVEPGNLALDSIMTHWRHDFRVIQAGYRDDDPIRPLRNKGSIQKIRATVRAETSLDNG
jgi:hypothetical protein